MNLSRTIINEPTIQAYNLPEGFLTGGVLGISSENVAGESASSTSATFARLAFKAIVITSAGAASTVLSGEAHAWRSIANLDRNDTINVTSGGEAENAAEVAAIEGQYLKLCSALEALGRMDEGEAHYLDPETVAASLEFAGLLRDFHVPPPKILPHGGDAVIFEWAYSGGVRYVTYDEGVARLRDQGPRAQYSSPAKFDLRRPEDIATFIQAIGGKQWRVKRSNSSI